MSILGSMNLPRTMDRKGRPLNAGALKAASLAKQAQKAADKAQAAADEAQKAADAAVKQTLTKTHALLVMDVSPSMRSYKAAAAQLVRQQIEAIKGLPGDVDVTIVFFDGKVRFHAERAPVTALDGIAEAFLATLNGYTSGTAVLDALGLTINKATVWADATQPTTSFFLALVTDGEENMSRTFLNCAAGFTAVRGLVSRVNATDRWTIVYAGAGDNPRDFAQKVGIYAGNVTEFDASEIGFATLASAQSVGTASLGAALRSGKGATRSFYKTVDAADLSVAEVKRTLDDVTHQFQIFDVTDDIRIDNFVRAKGMHFEPGRGFYDFSKAEKAVQGYKDIVLQNKKTEKLFSGDAARDLLGLKDATEKLKPGDFGVWRVFIKSTSDNRGLKAGTKFLYRIS